VSFLTDGDEPVINSYNKLRVIVDPSAASFIALLRKRGKYHVVPADNAVADGIRETATAMQLGKIKVSPACKAWIKEAQGYVWDETAADDRPIKENDHAMDDTRYFVKTMGVAKPRNQYVSLLR
jgi:phage terminase large subunit